MTILHKSDKIASIQFLLCALIVWVFVYSLAMVNYNLVHGVEYPFSILFVALSFALFPGLAIIMLADVKE